MQPGEAGEKLPHERSSLPGPDLHRLSPNPLGSQSTWWLHPVIVAKALV